MGKRVKKEKKKPYESIYSDTVLFHPDGSTDLEVLEDILYDLHRSKLDHQRRVFVTREQRERGFNPSSPTYETVQTIRSFHNS